MKTEVTNPETGEPITRMNVMRVFSYDIEGVIQQFIDDNRMSKDEELDVTYDDIMDYVLEMAVDDFHAHRGKAKGLIVTDQDGNEI